MTKPAIILEKIFFPIFLMIIALSWSIWWPKEPAGFFDVIAPPVWSVNSFLNGSFQKQAENFYERNFPGLAGLLYLKNDVYELLNLGEFHSSYSGAILQGSKGVLYERPYLQAAYGRFPVETYARMAQELTRELSDLNQLLQKRRLTLIVVMAPAKPDFTANTIPRLWQLRGQAIGAREIFPFYKTRMKKDRIAYVDCYRSIEANSAQGLAFPDTGTHWSMYAAGLCLKDISRILHAKDPRVFPRVELAGWKEVDGADHEERDLADLLNLWPPYGRGEQRFYLARFAQEVRPIPLTIVGDSFGGQLIDNMLLAGYIKEGEYFRFTNHIPAREAFLHAIDRSRVLVIIGNTLQFQTQGELSSQVQALKSYLEEANYSR